MALIFPVVKCSVTVNTSEIGAAALTFVGVELGLFDDVVANFAGDCFYEFLVGGENINKEMGSGRMI